MEQSYEVKFVYVLALSALMHVFFLLLFLLPYQAGLISLSELAADSDSLFSGRDIIVNLNQNDRRQIDDSTLLSDRDSVASGFVTKNPGDNWLNNALEFTTRRGASAGSAHAQATSVMTDRREIFVSKDQNQEYTISFVQEVAPGGMFQGDSGESEWQKIPDKKGINRDNALFFTNDGRFSYNTVKFKNFEYFRNMKNLIASNWFPPAGANAFLANRLNPITGGYTPGYTRINAIPSQEVRLYFTMDRTGRVMNVVIVDSLGNRPLDDSCRDAIINSKDFGKVPDDIPGAVIVIPFIFGYYVY